MAESLESRKFERKQLFDVPLPVRSRNREPSMSTGSGETGQSGTMAFSLMTKRGNRQQVCSSIRLDQSLMLICTHKTRTVELPSDSTFAIAMKTQQQAEREEQQRIKNLVLNYDLQQSDDPEGKCLYLACSI